MRISINKAIKSKEHYICVLQFDDWEDDDFLSEDYTQKEKIFEMKLIDFEKVDILKTKHLADRYGIEQFDDFADIVTSGYLWILKVEITNLSQKTMTSYPIIETFFIEDPESNQFPKCDHDFVKYSTFAKEFKMNVFSGSFPPDIPFLPKIPVDGAIPFLLPKEDNINYFLSVNGKIRKKDEVETTENVEHNNGLIYVLTNSTFENDLLKIGVTQRSPEKRANELSTKTGLPNPFRVKFNIEVGNCKKVEKIIHERLERYRYTSNREFFKMPIDKAISIIKQIAVDFPLEDIPSAEEQKKQKKILEIKEKIDILTKQLEDLEK